MKINPYLYFNGNAMEAIALYEKAFVSKAVVAKFKDVGLYDQSYIVPDGMEEYVMHANISLGDSVIMCCDTPEKSSAGEIVQLMVSLAGTQQVKDVFDALSEGGMVTMEPQRTFWSECFASCQDRFGVNWLLSYENEEQLKQSYGE